MGTEFTLPAAPLGALSPQGAERLVRSWLREDDRLRGVRRALLLCAAGFFATTIALTVLSLYGDYRAEGTLRALIILAIVACAASILSLGGALHVQDARLALRDALLEYVSRLGPAEDEDTPRERLYCAIAAVCAADFRAYLQLSHIPGYGKKCFKSLSLRL